MSGYDIAANASRVGTLISSGIGGLIEIENGIRKMIDKLTKADSTIIRSTNDWEYGSGKYLDEVRRKRN